MIQYQRELSDNIQKVAQFRGHCYLQKIYSSSTLICLAARFRGVTQFFYFGRGHGVEGFWVADKNIPAKLRRIDRFLEYLRKHLGGTELLNIAQIFNDRCIQIDYRRYGHENSFLFFWKGRKLYFLNYFFDNKSKMFCLMRSWREKEVIEKRVPRNELYQLLFEIGLRQDFSGHSKDSQTCIEFIIEDEGKKLEKINNSRRKHKSLQRKLKNIERDMQRIKDALILKDKLLMGELDFESISTEFIFKGIKIKLTKGLNSFQKRDRIFEKLKSYQRAQDILVERKQQTENEIKAFDQKCVHTFKKNLNIIAPYWIPLRKEKTIDISSKKLNSPGIKIFYIRKGVFFAIGSDATANDFLRSRWGKREDLWFHLDGYAGPHLVLKGLSRADLDPPLLKILASALRDHGKLEIGDVPIIFAQVKNIKGVKGKRGKIIYKKEKYMKIAYDKYWKNSVKEE